MPTEVTSATAASPAAAPLISTPGEVRRLSNSVDDMMTPGIGPDQSDCRCLSMSYISFDYAGTMANDPVIAAKGTFLPLDGSNEGKEFEIEWTTGAKMAEFAIVDDGGFLAPTASKNSLTNTSNWAYLQNSLKACSIETKNLLNGPRGIRGLEGIEWTLRRIKQPERQGLDAKNAKGRDKEYYTCLKVMVLPGEKKSPAARRTAAPKPAAAAPAAAAAASAPAVNGAATSDLRDHVIAALSANSGTINMADLPKAVFKIVKATGANAKDAMETGNQATEDYLIEQQMDGAPWSLDSGVLTSA